MCGCSVRHVSGRLCIYALMRQLPLSATGLFCGRMPASFTENACLVVGLPFCQLMHVTALLPERFIKITCSGFLFSLLYARSQFSLPLLCYYAGCWHYCYFWICTLCFLFIFTFLVLHLPYAIVRYANAHSYFVVFTRLSFINSEDGVVCLRRN